MKLNKSKNAKRNVAFGFILKIYQIIVPFIFRTVMVYTLGVEYLGLNSLFTSILQVLNLAELGVGSAMVFSMYKPIAEDDSETICALMRLYRNYYRIIGTVILLIGMVITPFVPHLITGTVPASINIYILYLLNLLATVLTYWLFAYRNSVLQAHQRTDVVSKVTIATDTFKYILQLLALIVLHSYYCFVISILITQVITNIITAICSKKMYPSYSPTGSLFKTDIAKINGRIKDLFTSKFGGTIVNSADTIVISAFLGLKLLAMYQNYFYIMSSVMAFITIINNSIVAGVGNSMLTDTAEKNYYDFKRFVFIEFGLITVAVSCFCTLYQPFMTLWMGKKLLFDFPVVIMLCIYFIGYEYIKMMSVYKDAGGIWHKDRYRPLISGIVNLVLNIIFVNYIGIYGILLSTIISMYFVSAPWITKNVFSLIFMNESMGAFLKSIFYNSLVIMVSAVISIRMCNFVVAEGIVGIIIRLLLTFAMSLVCFSLFNCRNKLFKDCINYIKRIIVAR